ncbi:MAG: hypothetical protein LBB79_03975 [Prevotellaceae bacterium]|nr:hypothetical protein [Prevotellaceae bacterium]
MTAGWNDGGNGGSGAAVGAERRRDSIGGGIGGVNAIPLGMERSVEKHPCHQTRHSVGMTPERVWTHS